MRFQWLNGDFFYCKVDDENVYNINYIRKFRIDRLSSSPLNTECCLSIIFDSGNIIKLSKYHDINEAKEELKEFLTSRPAVSKNNSKISIN